MALLTVPEGRMDLDACLTGGQVFRWERRGDVRSSCEWRGVDGGGWFVIRPLDAVTWDVESNVEVDALARFFRLDWDADAVEAELIARGPELEPYLQAMRGLRVMRPSDPVETFFSFLCTANNHIKRIGGLVRHLASFGTPMEAEFFRFPSTEVIAGIPPRELRARGFGYRAETIVTAAQEVLNRGGDGYLRSLRNRSYADSHEELITIPYVGRKLADCICLFALDQTEAVPFDTHIWQATTRLYFPEWRETALTDAKYRHASAFLRDRFGDRAGWAQQALFYENVLNWRARAVKPRRRTGHSE